MRPPGRVPCRQYRAKGQRRGLSASTAALPIGGQAIADIDIDMCRVFATAIFGDCKDHLDLVPMSWAQRWTPLQSGELDVVVKQAAGRCARHRTRLAQSEEMVLRARAGADGRTVLSIATLPTFGSRWLMPRLRDFLEGHPGVAVDVASRSQPFDLEAEDYDLAIHYGQP